MGFWKVFVEILPLPSMVIVRSRKFTEGVNPLDVHFKREYVLRSWRKSVKSFSDPVHIPNLSSMKRRRNGSWFDHLGKICFRSK